MMEGNPTPRLLMSYYYHSDAVLIRKLARAGIRIMIDSGAFSARCVGVTIDLEAYIEFLQAIDDVVDCYFTLDVMGSRKGTLANTRRLRDRGLRPIQIWQGYDHEWGGWSEHFATEPYVALGGIVSLSGMRVTAGFKRKYINGFLARVGEHQRAHLLGYVPRHWNHLDVDTLDSSSWVAPTRYGSDITVTNRYGRDVLFKRAEFRTGVFTEHQRKVVHEWLGSVSMRTPKAAVHWYGRMVQFQKILCVLGFLTKYGFTDKPAVYAAITGLDAPAVLTTLLRLGLIRSDSIEEVMSLVRDKKIFQLPGGP